MQIVLPESASSKPVQVFLEQWNLRDPVYVEYQDVGSGYDANFCHVSAKHAALVNGGRRVHGWALWEFDGGLIVGDFHSLWEKPNGDLVDLTPPKTGSKILFVRDLKLTITQAGKFQRLYNNRTNEPQALRLSVWDGNPTNEEFFEMPSDNPHLIAYCKKLLLPDTSMI